MRLDVRPANEATWDELQAVLGDRGEAARCQCQRCRLPHRDWWFMPTSARAELMRAAARSGEAEAAATSGLVGFLEGEPVGWCAVEPRTAYLKLLKSRVPWAGRAEDKADASVWAVACFVTRAGYRRRGVSRAMACAAVDFARARGARALEGYPMIVAPGEEVPWGELNVGARSVFVDAGFTEASRPTDRRCVMRIDFGQA